MKVVAIQGTLFMTILVPSSAQVTNDLLVDLCTKKSWPCKECKLM